jgi:putative flippase GtrA
MHETRRQFLTFCLIGVANTAIDAAVFFGSVQLLGLSLVLSNILAWAVAVQFSYVMNGRFTFRQQGEGADAQAQGGTLKRYGRFVLSNLTGLVVATMTLLLVEAVMPLIWAKFCAIVAGLVVNFILSKFYVFRAVTS